MKELNRAFNTKHQAFYATSRTKAGTEISVSCFFLLVLFFYDRGVEYDKKTNKDRITT